MDDLFESEFEPFGPQSVIDPNAPPRGKRGTPAAIGPAIPPQRPGDSEWEDSKDTLSQRPLADRLRPTSFDDYLGQEKLTAPGAPLRRLIDSDKVPSMILWGPPGSGKTTLASLIAKHTDADFITMSAVTSGVKDVRAVIEIAKVNRQYARRSILFIDEIHRFNKAQQDAFLPHVESGLVILIGATTENPSFSVISPLLSRCRVFVLEALGDDHILRVLRRGVELLGDVEADDETLKTIANLSDGDARRALGLLEIAADVERSGQPTESFQSSVVSDQLNSSQATAHSSQEPREESTNPASSVAEDVPGTQHSALSTALSQDSGLKTQDSISPQASSLEPQASSPTRLTSELVTAAAQRHLVYDRAGEEHFNIISALHKTIRSSDPHAALYWARRMIAGGEDPRYLLRRLMRAASEDIGMADPNALQQAAAAFTAYTNIGSPEGDIFVYQLAVYLACAPKSNSVYMAAGAVAKAVDETGTLPVPFHLRNAPTSLMKHLGYGEGYQYDHSADGGFAPKQGLPDELAGRRFYEPTANGVEARIKEKLDKWDEARDKARTE